MSNIEEALKWAEGKRLDTNGRLDPEPHAKTLAAEVRSLRSKLAEAEKERTKCGVHGCEYIGACPECYRIAANMAEEASAHNTLRARAESRCDGLAAALEKARNFFCPIPTGSDDSLDIYQVCDDALKDSAPILARVKAETKAEALRKAGDWFKSWKDMPASYERAGEALHRMADEAIAFRREGA